MNTEYDEAKKACILAYCNKVSKGSNILPQLKINYSGNFPYQKLVDSIQVPGNSKNKKENNTMHKRAWDKMYKLFNDLWVDKESW
jgi:hypothetical protein